MARRAGTGFYSVTFRKDDVDVYSTCVPGSADPAAGHEISLINRAYGRLKCAVSAGEIGSAALDFNAVAVGGNEYNVADRGPENIKAKDVTLKPR